MENIVLVLVVLLRLLVPLTIFRWALLGMFFAIAADAVDIMIFEKFGIGALGWENYHIFDKFFDAYYLLLAFLVARTWKNSLARNTASFLFFWRITGFVVFGVSSFLGFPFRIVLLLAPAIFEFFYVAWGALLRFFPRFHLTPFRLMGILLLVSVPKLAQEYVLHFGYMNQVWGFIRDTFFFWLY